jgi:hypothetical protein
MKEHTYVVEHANHWEVIIQLESGGQFSAQIPKSADRVDLMNFAEHLFALAGKQEQERRTQ